MISFFSTLTCIVCIIDDGSSRSGHADLRGTSIHLPQRPLLSLPSPIEIFFVASRDELH